MAAPNAFTLLRTGEAWFVDDQNGFTWGPTGLWPDTGPSTPCDWENNGDWSADGGWACLPVDSSPLTGSDDLSYIGWLYTPDQSIYDPNNALFFGETLGPVPVAPTGGGAPTVNELAGSLSGATTVTAALQQWHNLAATVAGVATVTGTLTAATLRELAGNSDGVSTVTGVLTLWTQLSGTTTGFTTVTGVLDQNLSGSSTGSATTVSGTLQQWHNLAGSSAGVSTVFGDELDQGIQLSLFPVPYPVGLGGQGRVELAGSSPSSRTTVTGTLEITRQLQAVVAGSTTIDEVVPATGTYKQIVLAAPAKYYWQLNELVSTTAVDATGTQNLTWYGTPPRLGAGAGAIYDENLTYTGSGFGRGNTTSQYVNTTATLTKATGDFSVEFWFKFKDSLSFPSYYHAYRDSPSSIQSLGWIVPGGPWNFQTNVSGIGLTGVSYDIPSKSTTAWYHMVYVASFTDSEHRIYVNGELKATASLPGTTTTTNQPGFAIGYDGGANYPFEGSLDDFAVYHFALTPKVIAKHYEVGANGTGGVGFYNVGTSDLGGVVRGSTTVTAVLANGANDGNGNPITELAGNSDGVTTVTEARWLKISDVDATDQSRFLYLYASVGFAFEPIDDASGITGFVSQTYPDGHLRDDFSRYLYLYNDVGVAFEDLDDASGKAGFVSQTYPDGHLRDDWSRYLYQYINVTKARETGGGQLVIRPGWSPRTNPAVPPAGKNV